MIFFVPFLFAVVVHDLFSNTGVTAPLRHCECYGDTFVDRRYTHRFHNLPPAPAPMNASPDTDDAMDTPHDDLVAGTVIRSTGSWCDVRTDKETIPARVRGRFQLGEQGATSPVAVGDRVMVKRNADATGVITHIRDRKNQLGRRAAGRRVGREHILVANIDCVWIVQSISLPHPNPGFVDRVLVTAEANEIPAGIVLNKSDLIREEHAGIIEELRNNYARIGYPFLTVSAKTGEGMDLLRKRLAEKTSVFTGPSGVGKSSLINVLEPGLDIKTSHVSAKTRKGRHTTAYATLFSLKSGGYIVDTPGVREFGVLYIDPWELSHYFIEFKPYIEACRFPTCTHDHEPDCAVKQGVTEGDIFEQRYRSYLNILDAIRLGDKDVGR